MDLLAWGGFLATAVQSEAAGGGFTWPVTTFLVAWVTILVVVCAYGVHRWSLVYLYYKHRRNLPKLQACFADLPRVTIQLPMYNEQFVARRIIENTCKIDYPKDKLQIQVLDDSTDDTVQIAGDAVVEMRGQGFDIQYIHRTNRQGYKAGALCEGLKTATGEFVAIFDADFIPPPDILRGQIHYFTDPRVGMVQARWEHINRDHSLLTKTQAVLLDGHFVIEHGARNRSGRFMSFNGTAGTWRRSTIEDAGGWQHDTLTEDLDLSYRAQMKGWKFIFLPNLASPAELPPEMNAFKAQQHRWAKGGAQTCKKLLPRILRSKLPWRIKAEAWFHLTSCVVYVFMVAMTILLFPALWFKFTLFQDHLFGRVLFDASLFVIATCSASSFYVCCERELSRSWSDSLKYLPFLMALGVGIALNNALAAIEGFFGECGEFVRTPKFGVQHQTDATWHRKVGFFGHKGTRQILAELLLAIYLTVCAVMCFTHAREKVTIGVPFLLIFMVGYWYVSLTSIYGLWAAARASGETESQVTVPVEMK
jgi:cellulose synthase/poly-beta-1,6-N-acetylglucosamine synthase-like glycosyltransferase